VDGNAAFGPAVGSASFSPAYSPDSGSYGSGFAAGYGSDVGGAGVLRIHLRVQPYSPTSPQYSRRVQRTRTSPLRFAAHKSSVFANESSLFAYVASP
jgi:hypothetical protein